MSIEHLFLDFDGTIMVYEGEEAFFHPDVITFLNSLPEKNITWYSNSGRGREGQQNVLRLCQEKGLSNMPEALLCTESLIYTKTHSQDYTGLMPWNEKAKEKLLAYHAEVQRVVKPLLPEWLQYVPPEQVYIKPMGTYFFVPEDTAEFSALAAAFSAAIDGVAGGSAVQNGAWLFAQPAGVDKGKIIQHYVEQHNIDPNIVLAVGDHQNDIPMLDEIAAWFSGCPNNATPEVKKAVERNNGYISTQSGPLGTLDVCRYYGLM